MKEAQTYLFDIQEVVTEWEKVFASDMTKRSEYQTHEHTHTHTHTHHVCLDGIMAFKVFSLFM